MREKGWRGSLVGRSSSLSVLPLPGESFSSRSSWPSPLFGGSTERISSLGPPLRGLFSPSPWLPFFWFRRRPSKGRPDLRLHPPPPLFASQLPLEWEKGRWPLLLIALATPLTMFFLGQGEASFLYHGHGSLLGLVLLLGVVAWRERPSVAALFLPGLLLTQSKSVYLALLLGGGWLLLSWVKGRFSRKVIALSALVALAVVALRVGSPPVFSGRSLPLRSGRDRQNGGEDGVAHIPWGWAASTTRGLRTNTPGLCFPKRASFPSTGSTLRPPFPAGTALQEKLRSPQPLPPALRRTGLAGNLPGPCSHFLNGEGLSKGSPRIASSSSSPSPSSSSRTSPSPSLLDSWGGP